MILRSLYDSERDPYTPLAMRPQNHSDYCAEQVRSFDYDRYFAATFAPAEARRGLLALYAFNLEIASARERVSEPLLGEIRLQWWRDAVSEIYDGSVREHAVAAELAEAIEKFGLPREAFDRMIDGRVFDMDEQAPEDINAFENYVAATAGELACVAYRICGVAGQDDQAALLGSVWGGTGLLRALPFHLSQRRVYLPKDVLRRAGSTVSMLADNGPGIDIAPAVKELADNLLDKLAAAEKPEKQARPAVAYVTLARRYLHRLAAGGNDVFREGLDGTRTGRQLRVVRSVMTGRV
ncbi:MAG: phytoene/squalene synthase family protein [Alphaproteobacteria bacterium]